jgi:hypothetical protein
MLNLGLTSTTHIAIEPVDGLKNWPGWLWSVGQRSHQR